MSTQAIVRCTSLDCIHAGHTATAQNHAGHTATAQNHPLLLHLARCPRPCRSWAGQAKGGGLTFQLSQLSRTPKGGPCTISLNWSRVRNTSCASHVRAWLKDACHDDGHARTHTHTHTRTHAHVGGWRVRVRDIHMRARGCRKPAMGIQTCVRAGEGCQLGGCLVE